MMGHKIWFYGRNMDDYPCYPFLSGALVLINQRKYPISQRLLHNRVIKSIHSEGVLCIVENICL